MGPPPLISLSALEREVAFLERRLERNYDWLAEQEAAGMKAREPQRFHALEQQWLRLLALYEERDTQLRGARARHGLVPVPPPPPLPPGR